MTALGDRHIGDLGGQLVAGEAMRVAVLLGDEPTISDQHTAWMLINLLVRLEGVVEEVILVAPDPSIGARVSPHAAAGSSFADAIVDEAGLIGGAPVAVGTDGGGADVALHVGAGPSVTDGWRVVGHGWQATLSTTALPRPSATSSLPFGPHAAACLAAAEVFRAVRLPPESYVPVETLRADLWNCGIPTGRPAPLYLAGTELDFGLAGVGAVGVAALHTLWSCEDLAGRGVIADNDVNGIDDTNLNRCVLFDRRHVGLPKASTAAEIYGCGQLEIHPIDGPYDLERLGDRSPRVLLSAVDRNESRWDLQRSLAPGVAFGASTHGLRAELLVFGPPGDGPCLACHNPVIAGIPDDVRRAHVRTMDADQLADLAASARTSPRSLLEWAETGDCGAVSAEALGHLLDAGSPAPMWSVGFVSVFAGVVLAAQLVKHALGHDVAAEATSSKFQFRLPQAAGNGTPRSQRRDSACGVCGQDVHRIVWTAHRNRASARV